MKVNKGWKELYKKLSWYNRGKFIEANRPFGKDPRVFTEMMMWLLAGLSITGVILNVQKNPAGFALWMFTNACWAVIDFRKRLYAQSFLFVVYFFLALWGLFSWLR
ncbi:MAG: nicotinamide mononucleotide transporter [Candidatus Omnitrophota bacterium]